MTHLAKALKFGIRGRLPIRNTYKSRLQQPLNGQN